MTTTFVPKIKEFKDKKLNKLWKKAQKAGFTGQFNIVFVHVLSDSIRLVAEEELTSLKVEFQHHQEKLDQFEILSSEPETDEENQTDENQPGILSNLI